MEKNSTSRFGIFDPRKYSATSVLMWYGLIESPLLERNYVCNQFSIPDCLPSKTSKSNITTTINFPIAERNRKIIIDWINHSKENGYRLVFADLASQVIGKNYSLKDLIDKRVVKETL